MKSRTGAARLRAHAVRPRRGAAIAARESAEALIAAPQTTQARCGGSRTTTAPAPLRGTGAVLDASLHSGHPRPGGPGRGRLWLLADRDVGHGAAAVGLDRDDARGGRLDGRAADVDLPRAGRVDQGRADDRAGERAVVHADVVRHEDRRAAVDGPALLAGVVLGADVRQFVDRRGQRDLRGVAGGRRAGPPTGAVSAALRTRSRIVIGVSVLGNRNVSVLALAAPRLTGAPLVCVHSNRVAPSDSEPSSVMGRFCSTAESTGAMTALAGLLGFTWTTTSSWSVVPPGPLIVSVNVRSPATVGALNVALAVLAPVRVTPDVVLHR